MTKAIRLQQIDNARNIHLQAWLNQSAKATKKRGKKTVPYFKTFNEFFRDPEKDSREEQAKAEQHDALKAMILQANMKSGG